MCLKIINSVILLFTGDKVYNKVTKPKYLTEFSTNQINFSYKFLTDL